MVDWKMLRIPSYRTKIVQDSTDKPDKNVKQVEIHPIEWDAQIFFMDGTNRQGMRLDMNRLLDFYVASETKGTIRKKEDLMIRMSFIGTST